MKILFVCDTMGSGGAERVISILSNSFSYRNHEVSILMLSSKASEPFYNLDKHIKVEYLKNYQNGKISKLGKVKLLRQIFIQHSPDVVISFLSYVCIYTWAALRKTNIPYVVSERNDPSHRGIIKQILLNMAFKKASARVFQTHDALVWYDKNNKKKSHIIYNPVELNYISKRTVEKKKQILYVGRFTKQKNCLMLLKAFSLFSKSHPDYLMKMYGGGNCKANIEEMILKENLSDKVFVLNSSKTWQADEFDSAMFVLPSLYEGMPNVLAEALCLGIPSVSTDCPIGGPKELKSIFGDRLILVRNNNHKLFALGMEKALDLPLQESCVPNDLLAENIVNKWVSLLESIKDKNDE